ncbi:uncharacterized protein LOC114788611 [Denticeps clupeoides]|uniref:uncharacterized protein LOC114788611 n=1 Tax=Denticeps clupeoides TaxID=299321 RepID=UPI0010A4EAC3|nr:uncharacterized protein LOC114788611 [Denticeps clupeoides]
MHSEGAGPRRHLRPGAGCRLCHLNGPRPAPDLRGWPEGDVMQRERGRGGRHVPLGDLQRRQGFMGPRRCAVPGGHVPSFPWEGDACCSAGRNWPMDQPIRGHCTLHADEWARVPPCCPPELCTFGAAHGPPPPLPALEFTCPSGRAEKHCWECVRERFQIATHLPNHSSLDTSGYNDHVQHRPPALLGGDEPVYAYPKSNRLTAPTELGRNGQETNSSRKPFFTTEIPEVSRRPANALRLRAEGAPGPPRQNTKSPGTVREQIRKVVSDLEEVLGGLKQVHLEMKEVVEQIDLLTSNIDLSEEDPKKDTSHNPQLQNGSCDVVVFGNKPNGDLSSHQRGVNGYPTPMQHTRPNSITNQPPVSEPNRAIKQTLKHRSNMNGSCLPSRPPRERVKDAQSHRRRADPMSPSSHRQAAHLPSKNQKPPPYPHNGRIEQLSGSLQAAPSTGGSRQLSTAV